MGDIKKVPGDDDIEEDIIQDPDDIQLQSNSARDPIGTSGGASSVVGIDQCIDTLKLEDFDYVEEADLNAEVLEAERKKKSKKGAKDEL